MNKRGETAEYRKARRCLSKGILLVLACLILALSCLMTGCGREGGEEEEQVNLYYLKQDGLSIEASPFKVDPNASDFLPEDMLLQLSDSERAPRGLQAPVSGFFLLSWSIKDSIMILNFSEEYLQLDSIRQTLVRAAMVHSLCQIEGIDSVLFLCRGNTLQDAKGKDIGNLSSSNYIYSSENEIGRYSKKRLHLYFANKDGNKLIGTYRSIVYNSNLPIERVVAAEVIKGIENSSLLPTLNPQTRILSVTTRDQVCYVNLDSAFLTEPYPVTPQVAIYSLVNSLTELPTVRRVQLSVNGSTGDSFLETMKLSTPYERNLSVVDETAAE